MTQYAKIACVCVFVAAAGLAWAQPADAPKTQPTFNPELALQLGADDYGMKSYVLVILKTGSTVVEDESQRKELFAGHFANMTRLAAEGKLVLAGPLIDATPKRGIFILNVKTIAEAEALVKTDPAVQAGVFDYELMSLYSSAALMKINELHKTIQKLEIK